MSFWQGIYKSKWNSPRRLVGTGLLVLLIVAMFFYNLSGAFAVTTAARTGTTATAGGTITSVNNALTDNSTNATVSFNASQPASITITGFPATIPANAKDATINSVVFNWDTVTTLASGSPGDDSIILEYSNNGSTWQTNGGTYTTTTRPAALQSATVTTKDGTNPWTWADLANTQMRIRTVQNGAADGCTWNVDSMYETVNYTLDTTAANFTVEYYTTYAGGVFSNPVPVDGSGYPLVKAGTYYLKITTDDTLNTPPTYTITTPANANNVTNGATTAVAGGNNKIFVNSIVWTVTAGNDGNTTITFTGTNDAGVAATNKAPTNTPAKKDTTAPATLSVAYYSDANLTTPLPTAGANPIAEAGTVYVKLTGSEALSTTAGVHQLTIAAPGTVNDVTTQPFVWDAANSAWKYAWTVSGANDGSATVTVTGNDLAGNNKPMAAPATGATVVIDTTLPTATITAPANSDRIKGTYTIIGTANDTNFDLYRVEYNKIGVGPWTQIGSDTLTPVTSASLASWNTSLIADGNYDLRLTVLDKATNTQTSTVTPIEIDNTAPTFSLEYYTDANLTLRSPSNGSNSVVSTGLVYVKLVGNEALSTTPGDHQLTIDAPGAVNDVTNQNFTWDAVNSAWKYAWNVSGGNDGDTLSMSVTGKDLLGNAGTSAPTSGGTVNINNSVLQIVSATSMNNSTVDVHFNKPLDSTTASDSTNYIITGGAGLTVSAASMDADDNTLVHLTTGPQQEITYNLTVNAGIKDFLLNFIDPAFRTATFAGSPLFDTAGTIDIKAVLCSTGRVEIRWSQFIGTASYTVLKSTDGTNWSSTNVGTALSYVDTAVTDYTNYFYKIRVTDNITTMTSPAIPAFPPDSNVHGYYAENTGLCAACHVIHGASGSKLIMATTKVNLCITCHDGTQSKYNTLTGEVKLSAGYGESPSGPFGPLTEINENDANLQTVAGYTYDGTYDPVGVPTSIHNLGTTVNGAPGGNTQLVDAMECTTCHNPHGSSNYRILKTNLGTSGRSTPIQVEAYAVTGVSGETVNYSSGMVDYCSACHSDFNQPSGSQNLGVDKTDQSGFNLSTASASKRMHPVNMRLTVYDYTLGYGVPITTDLPTESWTGTPTVICMTCHYAHGTKKAFTPNPTRFGGQSTALKRMDKMRLCGNCHDK